MSPKALSKKTIVLGLTALSIAASTGCSSMGKNTAVGTGLGVAAGAAVGAIIGHQTGDRAKGAAWGAALGGAVGGVVGNRMDKQAKELEKVAETKRTEQGIVTKLKSDILFDSGKANLKSAANQNISKLAAILKKYPENVITIKGYTDNTGSEATNAALSERRAESVKNQLVAGGVPSNTISVVGMGPANPVAENTTKEGRMQNRRVEVEITADPSKVPAEAK
jgi:outer membrane protein OmpA-like peptidoglycan-associated protein